MAIRKFNSVAGFTVGNNDIIIVDENANLAAVNLNVTSNASIAGDLAVVSNVEISNNLAVTGNAVIEGNLTVNGLFTYVESTVTYVTDPIVEQGGNPGGSALTSDDTKDRGLLLHYYSSKATDAFIGWNQANLEFALGSNVTVTDNKVTFNEYGNLRLNNINSNTITSNHFVGNGAGLTNINANSISGGSTNIDILTANSIITRSFVSPSTNVPVDVNTEVDSWVKTRFRGAKYIIKAGSDLGFQMTEVLLVHDDNDSFMTIYGDVSTVMEEIIILNTDVSNGNVRLIASGVASNTTVNFTATYLLD